VAGVVPVRQSPSDPRFLADLSAAYLARAARSNRPDDWQRALAVADRAITLDRNMPEAHFKRALALDGLHATDDARRAWAAYRTLDPASGWSTEAAARAAR
jgi:tetratricopeptide (TPR) repeat protein